MEMRQTEDHFQRARQEPRVSEDSGRRLQSLGAKNWLDGNVGRVTPSSPGSFGAVKCYGGQLLAAGTGD